MNTAEIILKVRNEQLKQELEDSKASLNKFREDQKKGFADMAKAIVAVFSVRAAFQIFSGFVADAQEAEESLAVLEAVVKTTGGAAGITAKQMAELAGNMEKVTKFSAENVQEGQAIIATFKNIKGQEFVDATEAAADMATVLKTDLKGSANAVAKALQDPLDGLTKLTKQGVTFTDQQKSQVEAMMKVGDIAGAQRVILDVLKSEYGGAAKAAGAVSFESVKNELGDIGEEVGKSLLPIIRSFIPSLKEMVSYLRDEVVPTWLGWFSSSTEGLSSWGITFNEVKDGVVAGTTVAVETTIALWDTLGARTNQAFVFMALAIVEKSNEFYHMLTVTIPEGAEYFRDNWRAILKDTQNMTKAIFSNMAGNIVEFLAGMKRLLTTGSANFKFTALTDGFESTLRELPKYSKRVPSELEGKLKEELQQATDVISKRMDSVPTVADVLDGIQEDRERKRKESASKKMEFEKRTDYTLDTPEEDKPDKDKNAQDKEGSDIVEGVQSYFDKLQSAALDARREKITEDNTLAILELKSTVADTVKSQQQALGATQSKVEEMLDRIALATGATATNTGLAYEVLKVISDRKGGLA